MLTLVVHIRTQPITGTYSTWLHAFIVFNTVESQLLACADLA